MGNLRHAIWNFFVSVLWTLSQHDRGAAFLFCTCRCFHEVPTHSSPFATTSFPSQNLNGFGGSAGTVPGSDRETARQARGSESSSPGAVSHRPSCSNLLSTFSPIRNLFRSRHLGGDDSSHHHPATVDHSTADLPHSSHPTFVSSVSLSSPLSTFSTLRTEKKKKKHPPIPNERILRPHAYLLPS